MRILIVIPSQDPISGNWVTARRFQHGLEKQGHRVAIYDTPLQATDGFRQKLLNFAPDATILLHAYRTGKPWLDAARTLQTPYIVLLTGTDVNHGLDDPAQSVVIRTTLQQASAVLLHNPLIAAEFSAKSPELVRFLRLLTPGITLGTAPYDLRKTHGLAEEKTLFLCPAGLRPVKGGLQLLEMFAQVAVINPHVQLAFCGPVLDESYARHLLAAIEKRPWASYLGSIPQTAMANAMRGADVIINNSQTEGLANALLEAATLGIPILASKIPGNAAVVRHNINGLLYSTEEEFVRYALDLLNQARRRQLIRPAPDSYNPDQEAAELASILSEAVIKYNATRKEKL